MLPGMASSRASPLPQVLAVSSIPGATQIPCGSGLARDSSLTFNIDAAG